MDRATARTPNAAVWDKVGQAYLDDGNPLWRRHADTVNRRLMSMWLQGGCNRALKTDLFDEAIGEGQAASLATLATETVGVDVAPLVVAAAQRRHPTIHGFVDDVRRLRFADGHFDLVVSLSTLDHFPSEADIHVALGELHRVMAPNGRLLITLDNPQNYAVAARSRLPANLLRRLCLLPYYCGPTLNLSDLRHALCASGFEIERTASLVHCPRVLAIPLCRVFGRRAPHWANRMLLRALDAFEMLRRTPLALWSGHFVAVLARRP